MFFRIYISILVFAISSGSINAEDFPKTLSASEAEAHFHVNESITVNKRTSKSAFILTIKGRDVERDCSLCNTSIGYGSISYRSKQNQVCLEWENVSYPESGCFQLIQLNNIDYELRTTDGIRHYEWTSSHTGIAQPIIERFERAILVDLSEQKPSPIEIETAIQSALKQRGWNVTKNDKNKIVANLIKSGEESRIMIKTRLPWIGIGFVEGYSQRSDRWLRNLESDIMNSIKSSD